MVQKSSGIYMNLLRFMLMEFDWYNSMQLVSNLSRTNNDESYEK